MVAAGAMAVATDTDTVAATVIAADMAAYILETGSTEGTQAAVMPVVTAVVIAEDLAVAATVVVGSTAVAAAMAAGHTGKVSFASN